MVPSRRYSILFFPGALRGTLNSSSKPPNELDSKCRLALFRLIKKQRKLSGSRAVQPDMTAFLKGGEVALGKRGMWGEEQGSFVSPGTGMPPSSAQNDPLVTEGMS